METDKTDDPSHGKAEQGPSSSYTAFPEITHIKKRAFLSAYAQLGSIARAAHTAEVNRRSHTNWLQDDAYAKAFTLAQEMACDMLEAEAIRRAKEGVEEPVFHQGKQVATIRKYSDTLLIFLPKGAMPHKYRESRILLQPEAQANTPETNTSERKYDWSKLSNEKWEQLKELMGEAAVTEETKDGQARS